MASKVTYLIGVILAIGLAVASPAVAHEGHDHVAPPTPVSTTIAPRAEASSSDFEIVTVARADTLDVYLDTFGSNEPVTGATLEIDSPAGLLKPVDRGDGLYTVAAPFLGKPGKYDLAITISARDKADVLTTSMSVPEAPNTATQPVQQQLSGFLGDGARFAAAAFAGFLAGVMLMLRTKRKATAAVAVIALVTTFTVTDGKAAEPAEAALMTSDPKPMAGKPAPRDVAQRLPDGSVFVGKVTQRILALRTMLTADETHGRSVELPGRIIPDPNASGLVQASVGGRVSPPDGGFKPLGTAVKAGDILAYVRPPLPSADATVQAQQSRELDQQISIVTRKVERLSAIQQVIAKSQLEDAQLELKGLKERRANLERVNREPEPLYAPVDGVIAVANAVSGQMAEPSSIIFQIVDPAKLWVEALAFEPQAIAGIATAQLPEGRRFALRYLGTGLADRNQAAPVQFAIEGGAQGLRPGQFLTVFAKTSDTRQGIALPRASVLRGMNGQAIVYEHATAERFVAREVRTEPLDGERVLIVSGLEPGKRIVTQGAELLDQIR